MQMQLTGGKRMVELQFVLIPKPVPVFEVMELLGHYAGEGWPQQTVPLPSLSQTSRVQVNIIHTPDRSTQM